MNWKLFLESVFRGDAEVMQFMQRLIGYAIAGEKSLGIIPVLYSLRGRSGLTTFLDYLKWALGPEICVFSEHVIDLDRARRYPDPRALALRDARIAVFCGFGRTKRTELSSHFKRLASAEQINARNPYGPRQKFINLATPFIVTNEELPLSMRRDAGLCARVVSIEFPGFIGAPDASAREARMSDPGAIPAWIAAGVRLWREDGLVVPDRFRLPGSTGRNAA